MIATSGTYAGQPIILACDAQCHKAWGINNRPRIYVGDKTQTVYPNERERRPGDGEGINIDDYYYLADNELGMAPIDPGTIEGADSKPILPAERLNKWCCRECERSIMIDDLDVVVDFQLPDLSIRQYNIKRDGADDQQKER